MANAGYSVASASASGAINGLFNNNGYVMVAAGADTLAKDFDKEKLMPMFQL